MDASLVHKHVYNYYRVPSSSLSEQHKVCKACYKVIVSYLKGNSRKNENYLARFIPDFQKQVI